MNFKNSNISHKRCFHVGNLLPRRGTHLAPEYLRAAPKGLMYMYNSRFRHITITPILYLVRNEISIQNVLYGSFVSNKAQNRAE